jgi:23S rRNA pseudouridine1911/1915/1917 synthase
MQDQPEMKSDFSKFPSQHPPFKGPGDVIYENDDFVAINKPSGLLSIPDREAKENSIKKILQDRYGQIFTVHRLDRETSGLIVFAKHEEAHRHLSKQFEERQTEKIYHGLVLGSLAEKQGLIDGPIAEHPVKKGLMIVHKNGKESLTDYTVLEDFGIFSNVKFRIYTGRTHQIRVHAKNIGHPVACDKLYGDGKPIFLSAIKHKFKLSKNQEEEKPILNRLALHAYRLSFTDVNGKNHEFEAPLPKDLRALLQQLRKWKT